MMNRNLLLTILPLLILVYSCTKEDNIVKPDDKDQKLYDVTFNVGHIPTGSYFPIPVFSDTLKKYYVTKLEYLVYDSLGKQLKDTIQGNTAENFGMIKLRLRAGNYKVHVIGSDGSVNIGNLSNGPAVFLSPLKNVIDDWMTKSIDLKVTTDQAQSQTMLIDRVLGRMEVIIIDVIPPGVTRLSVNYTNNTEFYLNASSPASSIQDREIDGVVRSGTNPNKLADFIIPDSNGTLTTNVTIRAYNSAGAIIAQKIIPNVKVERDKLTILSGNLFNTTVHTGGLDAGYTVSVGHKGSWYTPGDVNF